MYFIILYHAVSKHIVSYYIKWYYIISCYVILGYAILDRVISYYILSYYVISGYILHHILYYILCYVILYYVIKEYVLLVCYTILHSFLAIQVLSYPSKLAGIPVPMCTTPTDRLQTGVAVWLAKQKIERFKKNSFILNKCVYIYIKTNKKKTQAIDWLLLLVINKSLMNQLSTTVIILI